MTVPRFIDQGICPYDDDVLVEPIVVLEKPSQPSEQQFVGGTPFFAEPAR